MTAILQEILIILLLFVGNGVFAMSELAIVSSKTARLRRLAKAGGAREQRALELAQSPTNFLSTVQIGITLIGILAGAFGGVTISHELALFFEQIPALAQYSQALGLGIVVAFSTYVSLVIGELVPKRLALNNPERVAILVAQPMHVLSLVAAPLVKLLTFSTEVVLRLLGAASDTEQPITEEELKNLLRESAQTGELEQTESEIVERALNLDDIWVRQVMTPFTGVDWLDINDDNATIRHKIEESHHSRYPVGDGSLDHVLGIVRAKDILHLCLAAETVDLERCMHPPQFIPTGTTPTNAIEYFRQTDVHIALIIDEYGSVKGVITPMDILEAIVGDLTSPIGKTDPAIVQRADGSWLLAGTVSVDEFKRVLDLPDLPASEAGDYRTLGGFVMTRMKRIPQVGDCFDWDNQRFEVVDMDDLRVDRVLVSRIAPSPDQTSSRETTTRPSMDGTHNSTNSGP